MSAGLKIFFRPRRESVLFATVSGMELVAVGAGGESHYRVLPPFGAAPCVVSYWCFVLVLAGATPVCASFRRAANSTPASAGRPGRFARIARKPAAGELDISKYKFQFINFMQQLTHLHPAAVFTCWLILLLLFKIRMGLVNRPGYRCALPGPIPRNGCGK